jgi:hypothetical protein
MMMIIKTRTAAITCLFLLVSHLLVGLPSVSGGIEISLAEDELALAGSLEIPLPEDPALAGSKGPVQFDDGGFSELCTALTSQYSNEDLPSCTCDPQGEVADCWRLGNQTDADADVDPAYGYFHTFLFYDTLTEWASEGQECWCKDEFCASEGDFCFVVAVEEGTCEAFHLSDPVNTCTDCSICSNAADGSFSVTLDGCSLTGDIRHGCIPTRIPVRPLAPSQTAVPTSAAAAGTPSSAAVDARSFAWITGPNLLVGTTLSALLVFGV